MITIDQAKDYINQIKSLRLLLAEASSFDTLKSIIQEENTLTLDEIEKVFTQSIVASDTSLLEEKLTTILANRWSRIRHTAACYTESPTNLVNGFCLQLANQLSPLPAKEEDYANLEMGQGPYFLLMPSLKTSVDIMGCNIHAYKLHEFILGERDDVFIPVEPVLGYGAASITGSVCHVTCDDERYLPLTEEELGRLKSHSKIVRSYSAAIQAYNDCRFLDNRFVAELTKLRNALLAGSSHHGEIEERELDSGAPANVGIATFSTYWETIPLETKQTYFRKFPSRGLGFKPGLEEILHRLMRPQDTVYQSVSYCVELISGYLEPIIETLNSESQRLSALQRDMEAKGEQVRAAMKRDDYVVTPTEQVSNILDHIMSLPENEQRISFERMGYKKIFQYAIEKLPQFNKRLLQNLQDINPAVLTDLINLKDTEGKSALIRAAENGQTEVVKRLIDLGASLTVKDSKYGSMAIHWAASRGHLEVVKLLLEREADINAQGAGNITAVQFAIRDKKYDVAQALIEKGADLTLRDNSGKNALDYALDDAHSLIEPILLKTIALPLAEQQSLLANIGPCPSVLHYAIDKYPQLSMPLLQRLQDINPAGLTDIIDVKDTEGKTALIRAAEKGQTEVVKRLIDLGASLTVKDSKQGSMAIHWAASRGHLEVVKLLLERGADINAQGADNITAVQLAIRDKKYDVARALIEKGADLTLRDNSGKNALNYALSYDFSIVETILQKFLTEYSLTTADVADMLGEKDASALTRAAAEGRADIVKTLLDLGVTDKYKYDGCLAIHWAASRGHLDIVNLLLEKGGDINARSEDLRTALHFAIQAKRSDVARALIEKGANLTASNRYREGILYMALLWNDSLVEPILLKAVTLPLNEQQCLLGNRDSSVLHYAIDKYPQLSMPLLQRLQDINPAGLTDIIDVKDTEGKSALIRAAEKGQTEVVKRLIDLGASLTVKDSKDGSMAIHWAAACGHLDVVNLLLERGADINAQGAGNITALQFALQQKRRDVARALIEKGADLTLRDNTGNNVLNYAWAEDFEPILLKAITLPLAQQKSLVANIGPYPSVLHYAMRYHPQRCMSLLQRLQDINPAGLADIINVKNPEGKSVLALAAESGRADIATKILEFDPTLTKIDSSRAIHRAAFSGHLDIVYLLLKHGVDINAQESQNGTAVQYAIQNRKSDVARALIEQGADLTLRDNTGKNALDYAIAQDHSLIEPVLLKAITLPLAEQQSLLARIGQYPSVLHYAIDKYPQQCISLLQHLRDSNSNGLADILNVQGADNITAVQLAIRKGKGDVARVLIEDGADLTLRDNSGKNALDYALADAHSLIEPMLLKAATLPLAQQESLFANQGKYTSVLHYAFFHHPEELFMQLLQRLRNNNPDGLAEVINVKYRGQSVLMRAASYGDGNENIVKKLLEACPSPPSKDANMAILLAAKNGNFHIVSLILDKGDDLTLQDSDGKNVFDYALDGLRQLNAYFNTRGKWGGVYQCRFRKAPDCINAILLKAVTLPFKEQQSLLATIGSYQSVLHFSMEEHPNLTKDLLQKLRENSQSQFIDNRDLKLNLGTGLKKLIDIDGHIDTLQMKLADMLQKNPKNTKYTLAITTTQQLIEDLNKAKVEYMIDNQISVEDKKRAFKQRCLFAIKTAKPVLKKHRELDKLISKILLAIISFPVSIPLIACGLISFKTKSAQKLKELKGEIKNIDNPIPKA